MANSSCMFRTTTEASCAKYWMEFISLSCRHFIVSYRFCFDTLVRSSHTMLCSAFLPSSTRHSFKKRNATEYFESTQCLRITTWEWKRRSWRNSVYKQLPLYEIKWESINRVFSTRNRTNLIFFSVSTIAPIFYLHRLHCYHTYHPFPSHFLLPKIQFLWFTVSFCLFWLRKIPCDFSEEKKSKLQSSFLLEIDWKKSNSTMSAL